MITKETFHQIKHLFELAKEKSPFYQELYKGYTIDKLCSIEDIPVATLVKINDIRIIREKQFYSLNTISGICFNSSGTTGAAKSSFFDKLEWKKNNKLIAYAHKTDGTLTNGDIVGNLAYGGHASFMAVHCVLQEYQGEIAEISIGADREFSEIVSLLDQFNVTTITGIYSTFLGLANYMVEHNIKNSRVKFLLGGGELMYGAQKKFIEKAFPNARVSSFMYGSTDSGLIASGSINLPPSDFNIFEEISYVEIVDHVTLQPICELNRSGLLTVTNLHRINSPVIRYCNGDMAHWLSTDTGFKKFRLDGRVYPNKLLLGELISEKIVVDVITDLSQKMDLVKIQLLISRFNDQFIFTLLYCDLNGLDCDYIVKNSFLSKLPKSLSSKVASISIKNVTMSYFESQIRKRGKLIVYET